MYRLSTICRVLNTPVIEEQAWAICYQCLNSLKAQFGLDNAVIDPVGLHCDEILANDNDLYLNEFGHVTLCVNKSTEGHSFKTESELLYFVGTSIYQSLDYGISDNEERQLTNELELLIQELVADVLDEDITNDGDGRSKIRLILPLCTAHVQNGVTPEIYYKYIVSQMVAEVTHLEAIMSSVSSCCSEGELAKTLIPVPQVTTAWLNILEEIKTARLQLRKVDQQWLKENCDKHAITTLQEKLLSDIRLQRFKLRSVMVDNEPPQRVRKDVHSLTLQLIRAVPRLRPVNERPINPSPPRTFTVREQLLRELRHSCPQLKPVNLMALSPALQGGKIEGTVTPQSLQKIEDSVTFSSVRRRLNPERALVDAVTYWYDEDEMSHSDQSSFSDEGSPLTPLVQDQPLSLQDIVHIRSVIIKGKLNEAECGANQCFFLELQDGKICFCCQQRRFTPFGTESETCNLCGQKVCTDCLVVKASDIKKRVRIQNSSSPCEPPNKKAKKHSTGRLSSWSSLPALPPIDSPGKKTPENLKGKLKMVKQRSKISARMSSWKSLDSLTDLFTLPLTIFHSRKRPETSPKSVNFCLQPEDLKLCKRLDMCRDCATLVEKASN